MSSKRDAQRDATTREPTMRDVAREAGVSTMTVSNVLNDRPHVRPETRDRVMTAVAALGYRLNTAARELRQGRSGIIALAVPDVSPFFESLLASLVAERVERAGYGFVLEVTSHRREGELDAIARSLQRSYDGLLIHSSHLTEADLERVRGQQAVVVLSEREYDIDFDQVMLENEEGGRLAGAHLAEVGCRRPAMLGGRDGDYPHVDLLSTRTRGFRRALAEHDLPDEPGTVLQAPFSLEGGRTGTHALLDARPDTDGIFCVTDVLALGALRALHERGLSVPEQVKLVGFDGLEIGRYCSPSLSSIAPDHAGMVDSALDMLLARLRGERAPDEFRRRTIGLTLDRRESTGG
ncbi:LacI family DNA-binding transcriptional regulator [Brachybacterium sp. DNPG3]